MHREYTCFGCFDAAILSPTAQTSKNGMKFKAMAAIIDDCVCLSLPSTNLNDDESYIRTNRTCGEK